MRARGCACRYAGAAGRLVEGLAAPFMLRVDWDAERLEDVFLYAAYVTA